MLELYGSQYVIEHCTDAIQVMIEERTYREYVTDILAKLVGGDKLPRYHDLITPTKKPKETAEEVIARMKKKMRKL